MLRRLPLLVVLLLGLDAATAQAYVLRGHRWPGKTITVRDRSPYPTAVKEAMRLWNTSGVRIRFVASRSRKAQVLITSTGKAPSQTFGGCSGLAQLGYARGIQARMYLGAGCPDDLLTAKTVAHELGHILGLDHENKKCAVMNPVLFNGAPNHCPTPDAQIGGVWQCRTLQPDDLAGATRRYGGKQRLAPNETCWLFDGPSAPVSIVPRADSYGVAAVDVAAPAPPAQTALIAGVQAPFPLLTLTQQQASPCPASGTPPGPTATTVTQTLAGWGQTQPVSLTNYLTPGHWCLAGSFADPQGRTSPITTAELDIAPRPVR